MAGYQTDVWLHRDSLYTTWGFRLEGGVDYRKPFTIQRVQACSASEGQLKPGDHLVAIDGFDIRRLTHADAHEMIANAGSTIRLTIVRTPGRQSAQMGYHQPPSQSQQQQHRVRFASQPESSYQQAASSNAKAASDDESPIPRNSQLAKMMLSSITDKSKCQPRVKGLSGIDLLLRHPNPGRDITDYLPRRHSLTGRTTPLPVHHPPSTNIPYATMRPRMPNPQDNQMRSQLWDSIQRATSTTGDRSSDSGRSTPQSVAIEFGKPEKPTAVGVWTPPAHHPSAKLVHQQYNSPMALYTPHNVADQIQKQTGTKLSWQKKPQVRFLDDITDSPTYKFIHTLEHAEECQPVIGRLREEQPIASQSYSFKKLDRQLNQSSEMNTSVYSNLGD